MALTRINLNNLAGEVTQAELDAEILARQQADTDLNNRVNAIVALIGPEGGDADALVNTVRDVLVILQNFAEGTDVAALLNQIGALNTLTTTAKNTLVAAINEVNAKPTGSGPITFLDLPEQTGITAPAADIARVYAVDVNGITSLEYQSSSGFKARILRDTLFTARNESGAVITKGSPVYISGTFTGAGVVPIVSLARANNPATMPVVGLAAQDLPHNGFGRVMVEGRLDDLNTAAFAVNDKIFVSATTAGAMVNVAPDTPHLAQRVALVIYSHATAGSMLVDVKTMGGDSLGTRQNVFSVGDTAAGNKTVRFKSSFITDLMANATANRALTLPDQTGTLATTNDLLPGLFTVNASGAVVVDLAGKPDVIQINVTGNITSFTLTNIAGKEGHPFVLRFVNTGQFSAALTAGFHWTKGAIPNIFKGAGKVTLFAGFIRNSLFEVTIPDDTVPIVVTTTNATYAATGNEDKIFLDGTTTVNLVDSPAKSGVKIINKANVTIAFNKQMRTTAGGVTLQTVTVAPYGCKILDFDGVDYYMVTN